MIPLTESEINEIIDLAYTGCEKYILKYVNKKEFENIVITVNLNTNHDSFDIDIDINLDTDVKLPEDLAANAIEAGLEKVDAYVENRNSRL